jgi:hypothetical protein
MNHIQTTRMARAALAIVLLACGLAAEASPAAAQSPDPLDFALTRSSVDFQGRVNALDERLQKSGVQRLLAEANRDAVHNGPCKAGAFDGIPAGSQWYCFEPDDAGEGQGRVEWIPQGVTTVADAQEDGLWGNREALLVSWYDHEDSPEPKKGVRVTFLDPNTKKYRHVLLVYPYIRTKGAPAFRGLPDFEIVGRPEGGIHAGGIVWYGNYLYVVDTSRGMRVFDMRRIFDLGKSPAGDTTDRRHIGWGDVKPGERAYRGFGYRYVMPQVGAWINAAGPDNDDKGGSCSGEGAPKFSYIGLDRSEVPDHLVTGEYCSSGDEGRVARWGLNGDTGELRVPVQVDGRVFAADAYRLPDEVIGTSGGTQIQGAVSYDDTWYLSRSRGKSRGGQLIVAKPDGGELRVTDTRAAGIGPEDLSFWPAHDELWTVTEHAPKRMLYGVPR